MAEHQPGTPDQRVWESLRAIRKKDGHSLTTLARAAGISLGYMSDLEKGRREPSARATKLLASALNVPVSAIEKVRVSAVELGAA